MNSQGTPGVMTRRSAKRLLDAQPRATSKSSKRSQSQPQLRKRSNDEDVANERGRDKVLLKSTTQASKAQAPTARTSHVPPPEPHADMNDVFSSVHRRVEDEGVRVMARHPKRSRSFRTYSAQPIISSANSIDCSPMSRPDSPMSRPDSPMASPIASSQSTDSVYSMHPGPKTKRSLNDSMPNMRKLTAIESFPWEGTSRREKYVPDEFHYRILKATKQVMVAEIFTGQTRPNCTVWPEAEKALFETVMNNTWKRVAGNLAKEDGTDWPEGVMRKPMGHLARKLYDAPSDFRGHSMERARNVVGSHYTFDDAEDMQMYISRLLQDDAFTCISGTQGRFCSPIIIKTIALVFFQNDKASLGRLPSTAEHFDTFTGVMVVWVCTMLHNAISEYETGRRTMKKFEGALVERTHERLSQTWKAMAPIRQEAILDYLQEKVRKQSGWSNIDGEITPVYNEYADNIDDLIALGIVKHDKIADTLPEESSADELQENIPTQRASGGTQVKSGLVGQKRPSRKDVPFDEFDELDELDVFTYECRCSEDAQPGKQLSSKLTFAEWRDVWEVDEEVPRIWYVIPGEGKKQECVMDDDKGYQRFLSRVRAHGMVAGIRFGGPDDFIEDD